MSVASCVEYLSKWLTLYISLALIWALKWALKPAYRRLKFPGHATTGSLCFRLRP